MKPIAVLAVVALFLPSAFADQAARVAGTIRGRVVEAGTQVPVPGAAVRLVGQLSGNERPTLLTDLNGWFEFRQLPVGVYGVTATAEDYLDGGAGKLNALGPIGALHLTPQQPAVAVVIELWRKPSISGTVRDQDGAPVTGVMVHLARAHGRHVVGPEGPHSVTTDDLGRYRFASVPPGDYVLAVTASRAAQAAATPVTYAASFYPSSGHVSGAAIVPLRTGNRIEGLDLMTALVATAGLKGRLALVGERVGVAEISLALRASRTEDFLNVIELKRISTDAAGRFTVDALPAGQYVLLSALMPR